MIFSPVRRVHNEWGPQTVSASDMYPDQAEHSGLPSSIAERVMSVEKYLNIGPVSKDIYRRLKDMEDKIAELQAVSPEYAQFWVRLVYILVDFCQRIRACGNLKLYHGKVIRSLHLDPFSQPV